MYSKTNIEYNIYNYTYAVLHYAVYNYVDVYIIIYNIHIIYFIFDYS